MTTTDLSQMLATRAAADEARWAEVSGYERQADAVNAAARETGAIRVRAITASVIERGGSREDVMNTWLDMLVSGADDGWSGRTNDSKRSYFDGMRDEIREMRFDL